MQRFSVAGPAGVVAGLRRTVPSAVPPAVLVHGINGAAEQWSGVMDRFEDRTVIAVDLRGHGDSAPGPSYGASDYAADVAAAMTGLGIARAHLVGASFGGGVCVALAAEQPQRVRSLSIIGGALSVTGMADADAAAAELHRLGPALFFEQVAAVSFAPDTGPRLLGESVRLAARNDATTIESIMRAAFSADLSGSAAQVGQPALVLTGAHDATCPPALGGVLAATLGTECQVLPERGHMAHLEDPELIANLIEAHLRRTDPVDSKTR